MDDVMDDLKNFGFLLRDVSRLYALRYEEQAHELAVKLPQCKVLAYLSKNEGISQARLSQLADIDPMNLVRILDRMESDGWLERRAAPGDRRASSLYLKPRAKPLLDEIWRLAALTRSAAFAGVSAAERKVFISVLERVRNNLAAAGEAATVTELGGVRRHAAKAGQAVRARIKKVKAA
jgi:DNA-binding MarR family transcriptional regulator